MTAQNASIFNEFWNWRLKESPEFATAIGIHDFDSDLDDMGLAAFERRGKEASNILEKLNKEKQACVDQKIALNYELLQTEIEQYLRGTKFKSYLFPFNQLEGPQGDFPRLIGWMKTDTLQDYEKIISRFEKFPKQMEQFTELLKEGIKENYTMAIESIRVVPSQLESIAKSTVTESQLFKAFLSFPASIDAGKKAALKAKAEQLLTKNVFPAYAKLAEFLNKEYIPHVRAKAGIFCLKDGENYYQECLNFHTTTSMTPEQIHKVGLEEVAKIAGKMEEVMKSVKFEGSLKEFRSYMKTDPKFRFQSEEDMFSRYKDIASKIKPLLPTICRNIPSAQYVIEPVPKDMAPSFPGAYYLNPSIDGTRPGTFYLNTYKVEERSLIEVVSLSLHEAEPGHHLQCAYAMEQNDLPSFRRYIEDRLYSLAPGRFALNTGYLEGWGLYCEFLGEELGLYKDPYDYFGRLSHEMLRACRLVIDTGIHAFKWSREESIKYMSENTAMAETDVIAEVDRYITWPGQACAYKIGELKIKELRHKCQTELGDKFDVRDFHEIILALGAVPLHTLEDAVTKFISKMK